MQPMQVSLTSGRTRKTPAKEGGRKTRRRTGTTKAEQAVANGETTPTAAAIERSEDYKGAYSEWLRGVPMADIAEAHGWQQRRAEQVIDDLRAVNYQIVEGPVQGLKVVDRLLAQLDAAIGEVAEIQQLALDNGNLPVALGATRRKAEARQELLALQQARGLIPRNLGLLEQQADAQALLNEIWKTFEEFSVPDAAAIRLAEFIGVRTGRPPPELGLGGEVEVVGGKSTRGSHRLAAPAGASFVA